MNPGRELDALISEKVMGERVNASDLGRKLDDYYAIGPRHYSTDIAAAFEVVHQLETNGWGFILDNMEHYLGNWQAHFEKDARAVACEGGSAAHAIALAALKAVGA